MKFAPIIFIVISLFLVIFSYSFTDSNLTLVNNSSVVNFISLLRNNLAFSTASLYLYVFIIAAQTSVQILMLFSQKILNDTKLPLYSFVITLILCFAYPMSSHDIFSYLFGAKIVWYYHSNPYSTTPISLSPDSWLRFTHWVDSTYSYGFPSLLFSIISSLLSSGKFITNFYLYKLMSGGLFLVAGWILSKLIATKYIYPIWFFNPLLLFELVINAHNDLIMIALFFLAIYYFPINITRGLKFFLLSWTTKFISLIYFPIFLFRKNKHLISIITYAMLIYLVANISKVHTWYFTWLYMGLPLVTSRRSSWVILFLLGFTLLIRYGGYLSSGSWNHALFPDIFTIPFLLTPLIILFLENNLSRNNMSLELKVAKN